jgi:hypothetical protein
MEADTKSLILTQGYQFPPGISPILEPEILEATFKVFAPTMLSLDNINTATISRRLNSVERHYPECTREKIAEVCHLSPSCVRGWTRKGPSAKTMKVTHWATIWNHIHKNHYPALSREAFRVLRLNEDMEVHRK